MSLCYISQPGTLLVYIYIHILEVWLEKKPAPPPPSQYTLDKKMETWVKGSGILGGNGKVGRQWFC